MGGKPSEVVQLRAVRSLGLGFDLASDFRLKFAKGYPNRRLVLLDEENTADLVFPGGLTVEGVSTDISCDKGDRIQFCSDVLEFNQMSELFNQKSLILGNVPSGYFNALFNLSGAWFEDAKETKYLAFNGYFISLYNLHLRASPLVLCDEVKRAVPSSWEPAALSRFIRTYGTHVIVEIGLGGQDVICIRQNNSSNISITELKLRLEDVGELMFSDVPEVFFKILQSKNMLLSSHSESSSKDGLTIICSKRGGDPYLHSHSKWLQTVPNYPDAIFFKFVPITSLLAGIPGSGYLSLAIDLYLDVSSLRKPVVGLRLFLEGSKCNQLAIHIQHLSTLPASFASTASSSFCRWQSSEDSGQGFIEPVQWKRYSHVCTATVKHNPKWFEAVSDGVFVVTGAQILTRGIWSKKCLHLRLLFTHVPNCTVQKTEWDRAANCYGNASFLSSISATWSAKFSRREHPPTAQRLEPEGPPVQAESRKLLRFVDVAEVVRGPSKVPGHWLVVAAGLVKEGGKIGLQVKFALLNFSCEH
ncbi:hypothetical protein HPP92_024653 [Vanilla planifolia]|uniref:MACPF domain-containing protein n=1 Tax=Vanilla planifolia TaxID=51239 RepID=A0A835PK16_VANPL|nr:hypothetical protein HPP92_024653 [Vanilla planifolia]